MTKCTTCNKEYSSECDYRQGRCPHHPAMINIQPKDTSRGHFYVSLVKSFVRIAAGFALIFTAIEPALAGRYIVVAGGMLILAEILGIVEEIV